MHNFEIYIKITVFSVSMGRMSFSPVFMPLGKTKHKAIHFEVTRSCFIQDIVFQVFFIPSAAKFIRYITLQKGFGVNY